jgi:hypothetical protein
MIKHCTIIALIMLLFAGGCKNNEPENSDLDKITYETDKMTIAYAFLLKKLEEDNLNSIASKNNENLSLIQNIIRTNRLKFDVENYNNIEKGPDLCHYSKSTKKAVAIINITKRNEKKYYIGYYMGPEGGASKEILIEKRNGKWIVVNDDGMWIVK